MPASSTETLRPGSPEELADVIGRTAGRNRTIEIGGHFSKRLMGGPVAPADVTISTGAMNRVRQYEPRDLTISVEAGISYCELSRLLAEHHQMIPLDPAFSDTATVGGVLAANSSGPRRRLYGTARDLVIGMQFVTVKGKVVESGGMVVKNVAGLDMGKLMIGSFGTLAAIAVVNFKVIPQPAFERTFLVPCAGLDEAMAARDAILKGPLTPAAMDLLNDQAMEAGAPGYTLAVATGGNAAALARYEREMATMGARTMQPGGGSAFWKAIQNFTPAYLYAHPDGAVVRVPCTLKEVKAVMQSIAGPAIARAGSGICYAYFDHAAEAAAFAAATAREHSGTVVEFAPEKSKETLDLWPAPGADLELMKRIKQMLDPRMLLNRGRLYRHI